MTDTVKDCLKPLQTAQRFVNEALTSREDKIIATGVLALSDEPEGPLVHIAVNGPAGDLTKMFLNAIEHLVRQDPNFAIALAMTLQTTQKMEDLPHAARH